MSNLKTLNQIAQTLNRAIDARAVLNDALAATIDLMGLETGWIFLYDPDDHDKWAGKGYRLVAHKNLPPALALDNEAAWNMGCDCQGFCNKGKLTEAYNEVRCSRLEEMAESQTRGLTVHASVPMYAGEKIIGILNVAARDWADFDPDTLQLLTNIGIQMGDALERAWLYDQLRERRIDEQSLLLELSNQLLARPSIEAMADCLIQNVLTLLNVDACALLLRCDVDDELEYHSASGWEIDPVASGLRLGITTLANLETAVTELRAVHSDQPQAGMPDWMADEGFETYVYVPLIASGQVTGILMLNTRTKRRWQEDDLRLAQLLANQAAIAIETAHLHEQALQRERLEHELELGQAMQLRLLPKHIPAIDGWDMAAFYEGARLVSGDFYDFFRLDDQHLGMVIADVADKGVPAALIMAISRTMIRTAAFKFATAPDSALLEANRLIYRDNDSNFFITACYAVLNTETGLLNYTNAGHNPPLWLNRDHVEFLRTRGIVLGIFDQIPLESREVTLERDDVVVFYTDGLTEAMNEAGELFGEDRLMRVVRGAADLDAQQIIQAIISAVAAFTGDAPQSDDLTFFVLKRTA